MSLGSGLGLALIFGPAYVDLVRNQDSTPRFVQKYRDINAIILVSDTNIPVCQKSPEKGNNATTAEAEKKLLWPTCDLASSHD